MTSGPSVTVVVPLYNGAAYIHETISGVLRQTHDDLEVIVVDDGSVDDGVECVRSMLGDPRVRLAKKHWSGIADTRNTGLALSSSASEYVLFLDQDDLIADDLIASLLAVLAASPEAVAAYAIADFIDANGDPLNPGAFAAEMRARETCEGGRLRPVSPEAAMTFPELFIANHVYPPSGVLIRKRLLLEIGGFDNSYTVADDWDVLVRLARLGALAPLDQIKVGYRRHDMNASKNTPLNVRETRAVWANTYWDRRNSMTQRRQLRHAWRALQRQRSTLKYSAARAALASGKPFRAVGHAIDATAHQLLVTPLPGWRTRRRRSKGIDRSMRAVIVRE